MREREADLEPGCELEGEVVLESRKPDMMAGFAWSTLGMVGDGLMRRLGEESRDSMGR